VDHETGRKWRKEKKREEKSKREDIEERREEEEERWQLTKPATGGELKRKCTNKRTTEQHSQERHSGRKCTNTKTTQENQRKMY
jgi:hypothetical protein